jgi:hypothetical protein
MNDLDGFLRKHQFKPAITSVSGVEIVLNWGVAFP